MAKSSPQNGIKLFGATLTVHDGDAAAQQTGEMKRQDKIIPCPRCKSMETKFCYFNNYNVNQPRHFCKNCQRYWTAGGALRNVPVGAGRRKSKPTGFSDNGFHVEGSVGGENRWHPVPQQVVPAVKRRRVGEMDS